METAAQRAVPTVRGTAVPALLGRAPLAAVLAVLAPLTATAAVVMLTRADAWGADAAGQVLVDAAVGVSYPVIGAVVLMARDLARGTRMLAWVLLGSGVCAAVTVLSTAVALSATEASAAVTALAWLQSWLWVPGFIPLLTLVPLLYPDGLLPGRVWRGWMVASGLGIALLTTAMAIFPDELPGDVAGSKPVASLVLAQVLAVLAAVLLVPCVVAGVVSLLVRYRSSQGLARRQVAVLIAAAGVLLTVTLLQGLVPSPADVAAQAVATVLVPVAIGVAVTRHRLYELDTALRRALVIGSLVVCLVGVFVTVLTLARATLPAGATAVAAGLTGLVVAPLARRLSAGVDRLFYGDRADPYVVSTRMSTALAAGLDVGEVPQVVCDTVVQSLRLASAELWLLVGAEGVDEQRLAVAGSPATGREARFELRHRGEQVGWLLVGPRRGDDRLEQRDVEVLDGIADQVAPAVAALRLHEQLQLSRQSLVSAREEERRTLRRDLHDGLGATLAGVRLQVESAQAGVSDAGTQRLLESAGSGVVQAVAEVRALTDSLRPPALDELGLARSLRMLAERTATAGTDVRAEVPDLPRIDAAVEVAVYRIASEALANATRHARARHVAMELSLGQGEVVLTVADDGTGLPVDGVAAPGSGLGLASMRTRAEEIGGSLTVGAADPGGVQVTARLPVSVKVVP